MKTEGHIANHLSTALVQLTAMQHTTIGRIHKNEQLLDWPFTRLLLESLYIKNE